MKRPSRKKTSGFTLLEMLAAVAIFSLLALSARQLLVSVMNSSEASTDQLERLHEVEYAMLILEQDFRQLVDRGVRVDGKVTERSLFAGKDMLDSDEQAAVFVRGHWRNPQQRLPRSQLQRVYYRLHKGYLQRMHNYVLDAPENIKPVTQSLLSGVKHLSFRYFYDDQGKAPWQDTMAEGGRLPKGVAVILTLNDLGTIERRFILPAPWSTEQ